MLKLRQIWHNERGFSIFEMVIAVFILGTVVTVTLVALADSLKAGARAEESVALVQLIRAQIEAIQQSSFKQNPAEYPLISGLPEGWTVTFTATGSGTSYFFPGGTPGANEIQRIEVTAKGESAQMSMTFYKVRMP